MMNPSTDPAQPPSEQSSAPSSPPASEGPQVPGGPPLSSSPGPDAEWSGEGDCPDCKPGALDAIHCRPRGVKAEADYDEAHKDSPSPEQYEAARLAYGKARHDATTILNKVRGELNDVTDKLRCLIDDDRTVECLDKAWRIVRRRLKHCSGHLGCCARGDSYFDVDVSECGIEIVKARIAEYEHRTRDAEDCFKDLFSEPGSLTKRVADLQAEVDAIVSDIGKSSADTRSEYAKALVAAQHLHEIWRGFDDPHEFVECLCLALRISSNGRAALSTLTGELALRTCRWESRNARCQHLREHPVEAILEQYVHVCQPRHPDDDDDDDDDEGCGCRKSREGHSDRHNDRHSNRDNDPDDRTASI
jgi:hypothetical protein